MADWNLPTGASPYDDVPTLLKALSVDAATLFVSEPTNPVDDTIKLNRSPVKFQERGSGTWADVVLSVEGGGTGAATIEDARNSLGLGSLATQDSADVEITGGTIAGDGSGLTDMNASNLASGTVPDARFPTTLPTLNGSNLTALNASSLASGTVPDARFPSTLPPVNGSNLTALNASNLTSGTVPDGRFPSTLPVANGSNLTALNASNLASGKVPDARFPPTLPVANGSNLTALNASNLTSGTVPDARFPSTLPALNASNLTALNASNLASGTVPQGRKWSEVTTTNTGNQDNFSFSGADLLRCNNTSLLNIRGLAAGVAGQRLAIVSVSTGQVDLANQDTNSTNVNRIINGVTGTISLAAGRGRAFLEYDGQTQRWRVMHHEQGAYITQPFNSADFTANGSMTWTVDSGDVEEFSYYLRGDQLSVNFRIANTTVGGTLSNVLQIKAPGGFTFQADFDAFTYAIDAGAAPVAAFCFDMSSTLIGIGKFAGNWSAATNSTKVAGQFTTGVA